MSVAAVPLPRLAKVPRLRRTPNPAFDASDASTDLGVDGGATTALADADDGVAGPDSAPQAIGDVDPADTLAIGDAAAGDFAASEAVIDDGTGEGMTSPDAANPNLSSPDTVPGDTGSDATTSDDTSGAETTSPPETSASDTAAPAPDTEVPPAGQVGACGDGEPGYSSCWIQAFVQCLQPSLTCTTMLDVLPDGANSIKTSWSNGSVLTCKMSISASSGTITCTGMGPDGKQCLLSEMSYQDNAPGPGSTTGPNGSHTTAFAPDGGVTILCGNGAVENYPKMDAICDPLQPGMCQMVKGGGG